MKGRVISTEAERDELAAALSKIKMTRPWYVEFKHHIPKRSNSQNAFSWEIYKCIADEFGHTKQEIHDHLAKQFAPPVYKTIMGVETVTFPTKDLPTNVMSQYIERCLAFAAEWGIPIPIPGDYER